MHLPLLLAVLLFHGLPLCANGLGDQEFYILPLREFTIDPDALARYTPGGSLVSGVSKHHPDFELNWNDFAIGLTFLDNDPADLRKHYGKHLEAVDPRIRPEVERSFTCKRRIKVVCERGGFPTPVQAARQILLCDKLRQLGGGYLLTPGGLYHLDGRPVRGQGKLTTNYFFLPVP